MSAVYNSFVVIIHMSVIIRKEDSIFYSTCFMPRQPRIDIAGEVYHVINRANARSWIFNTDNEK